MRKISAWKILVLVLCTFGLLASCGLKGDLYLPEGQASTMRVA